MLVAALKRAFFYSLQFREKFSKTWPFAKHWILLAKMIVVGVLQAVLLQAGPQSIDDLSAAAPAPPWQTLSAFLSPSNNCESTVMYPPLTFLSAMKLTKGVRAKYKIQLKLILTIQFVFIGRSCNMIGLASRQQSVFIRYQLSKGRGSLCLGEGVKIDYRLKNV